VLALAQELATQPLRNTEVHLAFTGCEEVGACGMAGYLDAHSKALGAEAFYLVLDEVGAGRIKYLTADGLLLKHKSHARAMEVASQAAAALPEVEVHAGAGIAYTDALRATQRGLPALTVCTLPTKSSGIESHWHQMSDTFEFVIPDDLERVYRFTRQALQVIEQANAG
jgi:acetylornithine deacetylase/succinyl-diaminopimelate desuccinylase-like protein